MRIAQGTINEARTGTSTYEVDYTYKPVGLAGPCLPGHVVRDATGRLYRPRLDRDGKIIVRPTKPGDWFLANSREVRVHVAQGPFVGLVRQILDEVPE